MRLQLRLCLVCVVGLLVPSLAQAQNPKNPTIIEFSSIDHASGAVTGYEADIQTPTGGVVQTLTIAKSAVSVVSGTLGDPAAVYRVSINVQPITFGSYITVMRTVAGAAKSDNSLPSNPWDRVPGPPGKPAVK